MKNIAIAIIISIVVSFSSVSLAAKLDISESAVKNSIILDGANVEVAKGGHLIARIKDVEIIEQNGKNTQLGTVKYYVVTADVKIKGVNFYSKGAFLVITIDNGFNNRYIVHTIIRPPHHKGLMQGYHTTLADFMKKANSLDKHQVILAKFAVGGRHL